MCPACRQAGSAASAGYIWTLRGNSYSPTPAALSSERRACSSQDYSPDATHGSPALRHRVTGPKSIFGFGLGFNCYAGHEACWSFLSGTSAKRNSGKWKHRCDPPATRPIGMVIVVIAPLAFFKVRASIILESLASFRWNGGTATRMQGRGGSWRGCRQGQPGGGLGAAAATDDPPWRPHTWFFGVLNHIQWVLAPF